MLNEGAKAEHTSAYVSISLSEVQYKKSQSEQFLLVWELKLMIFLQLKVLAEIDASYHLVIR